MTAWTAWLALVLTSWLSVVFLVSGVGKARSPGGFAATVRHLGVPPRMLGSVMVGTILGELLVAIALVILPEWGRPAAVLLLLALTGVIVAILRSGEMVPCGCFGRSERPVTAAQLWRNVVLLAAGAVLLALPAGWRGFEAPELLSALGLGLLLAAVTATWEELSELVSPARP